jgi:uncharacterized membrane protein
MNEMLMLIILTLMPFLELRASIPYGIFSTDLHWGWVFMICALVNIILAPIVYYIFLELIQLFRKIKAIDYCYQKTVIRTQRKVHKSVEKYGVLGLALFIGVPLPGSGVYSGALAADLLGVEFKDFFKAAVIGVLIAGLVVLLVSLLGNGAFEFMLKRI